MEKIQKFGYFAAFAAMSAAMTACIDFDGDDSSSVKNNAQISLKETKGEAELKSYLTASYQRIVEFDDEIYAVEAAVDNADSGSSASTAAFSGTNLQVEGVDEGDIWKYDGEHFYVIKPEKWDYTSTEEQVCYEPSATGEVSLTVEPYCYWQPKLISEPALRVVKNTKEELASVSLPNVYPDELYLHEDRLMVIGNRRNASQDWQDYANWHNGRIDIQSFDVSIPSSPTSDIQAMLDGYLVQSRRVGDELILVTRFSPFINDIVHYPTTEEQLETNQNIISDLSVADLLPNIVIGGVSKKLVSADDCYIVQGDSDHWGSASLSIVTRLNVRTAQFESSCMAGDVEGIHMSQDNLYLFNTTTWTFDVAGDVLPFSWMSGNTHIHKFSLTGDTTYVGSNIVEGRLGWRGHRNFRLGELNDGSLAMVTGDFSGNNKLTVLKDQDAQWQQIAQIPNESQPATIGKPNEQVYSVRFMQDRAYVVTFEQIDPLYVIDLSDSANPTILGELEIPGFSDYLHPVGDDLILGIGKDAKTGTSGRTWIQGVKVSLFDVSDMNDPKELASEIIGKRGSDTALSYNHHAFSGLQVGDVYRFTLPIRVHDQDVQDTTWRDDPESKYYGWSYTGLHLFEVENDQLSLVGAMKTDVNSVNEGFSGWNERRGLIQGDDVYHLVESDLYHADWDDPDNISVKF